MITLNQYIEKNYKVGFKTEDIKNLEEAKIFILAEQNHFNPQIIKINSTFIDKFSEKGDSILLEGFAQKKLTKEECSLNYQVMGIEKCIEEKGLLLKGWDKDSMSNLLKLDEKEKEEYQKIENLRISQVKILQKGDVSISTIMEMREKTSLNQASESLQKKFMEFSKNTKLMMRERTQALDSALSSEELNENRVFVIAGSIHVLTMKQMFKLEMGDLSDPVVSSMISNIQELFGEEVRAMQKELEKTVILFPKINI